MLIMCNVGTTTRDRSAFTHFAFYAGWPKAMSAVTVAKNI
jgi:alkylhydroperoxidase/carboxymuconolactone decarboxylase family protein YurZ